MVRGRGLDGLSGSLDVQQDAVLLVEIGRSRIPFKHDADRVEGEYDVANALELCVYLITGKRTSQTLADAELEKDALREVAKGKF